MCGPRKGLIATPTAPAARHPGQFGRSVHAEVAPGALADAGLTLADVDGSSARDAPGLGACRWPTTSA